jgi:aspartokinase
MVDKVPMEGVKRCEELVRVSLVNGSSSEEFLPGFLRTLTQSRINMNLFVGRATEKGLQLTCCMTCSDGSRVRELSDHIPDLRGGVEFHQPVDLISIFPHHFNLKMVGLSLMAFARAQIPLYGICSSLSALTFITDHTHSDKALEVLKEFLALPADRCGAPC